MARPKVYSKDEDLRSVPLDQEVVVALDLSADQELAIPKDDEDGKKVSADVEIGDEDDVKNLSKQIEDLKASNKLAQDQLLTEQQQRRQAEMKANENAQAAHQFKSIAEKSHADQMKSALDAAQAEEQGAKKEYMAALEAGNFQEAAEAQQRMSRAAAQLVSLEGAIANFQPSTTDDSQERRAAPAPVDITTAIDNNANFLPAEKTFLKAHPELLTDNQKNAELGVAYNRAMREGLSRGTPEYFKFIEEFMGFKKTEPAKKADDDDDEADETRVAAPVRRDNAGSKAPTRPTQVKLSPAQRELAANMGISELGYARQLLKLQDEKQANPEKYNQSR